MIARLPVFVRVLVIGGAALVMLLGVVVLVSTLRGRIAERDHPPATPMASPGDPIPAEAQPYRIRPGDLAVTPDAAPRPQAHPRTLAIHRSLRAYPGAPPRIPHGLTDAEFRQNLCNSCHARGGFAPRFGTYAPVTPHPEFTECLQCHAPDAMTVGLGIPGLTANVICAQCHVDPDSPPPSLVSLDWSPRAWPELGQRAMEGSPPWIPHDLQLRENCLACHGGPSAIPEIRTTHPERADCRACHVPARGGEDGADAFSRPMEATTDQPGDAR
jgi:nitrate reductase (cytochrome), electron transfer subunit